MTFPWSRSAEWLRHLQEYSGAVCVVAAGNERLPAADLAGRML